MAAVESEGHAAAVPSRFAPEGEATRLLYERHQRKILSFCKHQLGSREEAEDATQITFMNAFRGLKRGTSPEFESAWLFKIAHNVCLTKQRNSYRRRLVEAPSDFELLEERVPAYEGDTDELFGLQTALRVVPEQQRRALLLREWQGLSYKEIADEMCLSQAAVETLLFRARRSLADALTSDPAEKRKRGRPRVTSNVSSAVALLKSLLVGGGVKVAATVATVAATSVAAATPSVRDEVINAVSQRHASPPPAAPAPVPRSHVALSVAPTVQLATSRMPPARPAARHASNQARVATPTPRPPTVASEPKASAPVERPAAAATPEPGAALPSVPIPAPASADPARVSQGAPPAEPAPEPTSAPAPAMTPTTSSAPAQQSAPSPSLVQSSLTAPTQTAVTPLVTTPIVTAAATTPTTTTQTVNAPAVTTTTMTTAPAATQPTPVQTTTTQTTTTQITTTQTTTTQTTTTAAPAPAPVPVVTTSTTPTPAPAPAWILPVQGWTD